jgi:hypothetical protein
MRSERVFVIGGEGGSISISRVYSEKGVCFVYHQNEFDPVEDGPGISINEENSNFESPFHRIDEKYPWHCLYLLTVHDDYKEFVAGKLKEKLNSKRVFPNAFFNQKQFEEILCVKFSYNEKTLTWDFYRK